MVGIAGFAAAAPGHQGADGRAAATYLHAADRLVATTAQARAARRALRVGERRVAVCAGTLRKAREGTAARRFQEAIAGYVVGVQAQTEAPAVKRFLAATSGLRWRSAVTGRAVRRSDGAMTALDAISLPVLCDQARSWAASGFSTAPAGIERFDTELRSALKRTRGAPTVGSILLRLRSDETSAEQQIAQTVRHRLSRAGQVSLLSTLSAIQRIRELLALKAGVDGYASGE